MDVFPRETVLVVEDEPAILTITERLLLQEGYVVLAAATPEEAIQMAQEYGGDIHLLLTDVMMPKMNGHVLAEKLLSTRPQLKCLFMSGFKCMVDPAKVHFIQKPFAVGELKAKVRQVLDGA